MEREAGAAGAKFLEALALMKASRKRGRLATGPAEHKAALAKAARLIEAELKQRGQLK